jgi:hypothetical protein
MVAQAEEDQAGLRWVYLDGSVVFQYQRVLAVPFRDFISRVDVGRSLEMMNDYLGGGSVVVARDDEENRVTHRMVRTVYLPQPNFQVLFGGCPIDVSKLQYTRYDKTVHKTYWRTVKSINGSATYDDGSVAFRGLDGNQMRITVVARQQFTLPLFWQAVQIDLQDAFKRAVLEYAYRQYFARTLANFEAAYERRDFRVGRDSLLERGRGDRLAEFARRWISRDSGLSDAAHSILAIEPRRPTFVDDDGWQYFDGPAPTSSKKRSTAGGEFEAWLADLSAAMRRDLGMASPTRNRRHRPGP